MNQKVNSYERKGRVDSRDVPIQDAEQSFSMADTAAGINPLTAPIVTEPASGAQLSMEAFMAQPIEIHFHEPATESEPQYVEVTVNGIYKIAQRGTDVVWPRSHIEVVCHAKTQRVSQQKLVDGEGTMGFREVVKSGLAYPFNVIHDPSGREGQEWMKRQLNAA